MKKSLIALAVLAASGASFAQSSVTLYGIVDAYVGSISQTGSETQMVVDSGGVSDSRWGIKGSEDLGGGLKANFLLEKGFDVDSGKETGSGFNRQAYVGFSGGFGEVKLGNVYTAYDDISGSSTAVFDSALAPANGPAGVWLSTGYNGNPGNNVYYVTPSFGGFSAAVSYALGENKTSGATKVGDGSASAVTSLNAQYAAGPLFVGFGYQTEAPKGGGTSTDFTRLAATYDLGVAKVLAGYGYVKKPGDVSTTEWQLGVDYSVASNIVLSASYAYSDDNANAGDVTRKGYGFAAAYVLSKRTTAYGGFTNKTNGLKAGDVDTKIFAVGVKHTF